MHIAVTLFLQLMLSGAPSAQNRAGVNSKTEATAVVDLRKLGWSPPRYEPNGKLLRNINIAKLESFDHGTRVLFLSDEIIAVYHTKEENEGSRRSQHRLEAFFVQTKDGTLISSNAWPVSLRKSTDERRDSQARIVPLNDGRFLVFAEGLMMLYSSNLRLERQKTLEPFGIEDLWAAQSVAEGREIFLRHESTREAKVTYSWLNSETLEVNHEQPGYQSRDFSVQGLVDAGERSVFTRCPSGLLMVGQGQEARTVCDDQVCRGNGSVTVLTSGYIGVSSGHGIGIVSTDQGLIWSRPVEPPNDTKDFEFGKIGSSTLGTKFAVWVLGVKKRTFDGVTIAGSPILLVYDRASPQGHPLSIPIRPTNEWDYAFSPSGGRLVVFDGVRIRIYTLD